jgi:hypothetical protein
MDDPLSKLLRDYDEDEDLYNCGLAISNPQGFSLIQASYDLLKAELSIQPKRFWHEGPHDLPALLAKFRGQGYRVEAVGQDQGDQVFTIIRSHLILSSETLVRMMLHWINGGGGR